jgi:glucokinase
MLILAGDIGGTKTELALYEDGPQGRELASARFSSRSYPTFDLVLKEFLRGQRIDAAGFAVAGPVVHGVVKATNLPWHLESRLLSDMLSAPVGLCNDFAATVRGVPELPPTDLEVLAAGETDPEGPFAVIGAGTGLGEGIGIPTPSGLIVLPSEGGHTDFAARNEVEVELLRFLQERHHKRVSIERAVSGPGLVSLHAFVLAKGLAPGLPETALEMQAGDPGEVIGRKGLAGLDPA